MATIYEIAHYPTSKDYERLAELAQKQSIICIVDYEEGLRDVAHTIVSSYNDEPVFQVSGRGTAYIYAFGKEEFLKLCERKNLEFLDPENLRPRFAD